MDAHQWFLITGSKQQVEQKFF